MIGKTIRGGIRSQICTEQGTLASGSNPDRITLHNPNTIHVNRGAHMLATKGYAAHKSTSKLVPFEFQRRDVGPDDVLVEIMYCGVCHSDIHQVRNEWNNAMYPVIPGHEIVGCVKQTGRDAARFKTDDIVGVGVMVDSCGKCENCKRGLELCCSERTVLTYNSLEMDGKTVTYGGYSNQIVVKERFVYRVSEELPLHGVAPLLCAGITTYSPLRRWKVGKGHKVGVLGLGGLGHMAVKFAASFGAEVTMLSRSSSKEADAKKLGAHNFVLTTDSKQVSKLKNHFDFIVDTVSATHDYGSTLAMLNVYGVLINVGLPPAGIHIDGHSLITGDRSVTGSAIGGVPETQEMLEYCAEKGIVSEVEVIRMDEVNEAYERALKGDVRYRFVIDMKTL